LKYTKKPTGKKKKKKKKTGKKKKKKKTTGTGFETFLGVLVSEKF